MTFWQENYGFVKDVYDFRLQKYQEWMDNLEGIVAKVMAPGVQYTYKEFKIIQDSLGSLTRDLEKEGMKEWLDMMLEKVSMRVADADAAVISSKDKEFKTVEKKKLQALVDRHDKLMPPTQETQAKVEVYARCYAYGDDIGSCLKTLEEMRHLSCKEIHPHNMNMVEEQIEKADKVIGIVESQREEYEALLKRGKKLLQNPNKAPFLTELIEKMEHTWKEANEQSKARHAMLCNSAKDWDKYDEMRNAINGPVEKLENELKRYRKFFDPVMGAKKLAQKLEIWEEEKKKADDMLETIKKCYLTIIVLAGDDKKDFLDKEVAEVEEKRKVITQCKEKLDSLVDYNKQLTDAVAAAKELKDWAIPVDEKITEITTDPNMSPEDRVREILILQEQSVVKFPLIEPLAVIYKTLLTEENLEKSETAKTTMATWTETKDFLDQTCAAVEKESGSITQDQRFYADYLYGVKEFKPWMDDAETTAKTALPKPATLADALALLDVCTVFDTKCVETKVILVDAGKARDNMEKSSSTLNEVEVLTGRWDTVKTTAADRVEKVKTLVGTWDELQKTTDDLTVKMAAVPGQEKPDLEDLEKIFLAVKELYAKKTELMDTV